MNSIYKIAFSIFLTNILMTPLQSGRYYIGCGDMQKIVDQLGIAYVDQYTEIPILPKRDKQSHNKLELMSNTCLLVQDDHGVRFMTICYSQKADKTLEALLKAGGDTESSSRPAWNKRELVTFASVWLGAIGAICFMKPWFVQKASRMALLSGGAAALLLGAKALWDYKEPLWSVRSDIMFGKSDKCDFLECSINMRPYLTKNPPQASKALYLEFNLYDIKPIAEHPEAQGRSQQERVNRFFNNRFWLSPSELRERAE